VPGGRPQRCARRPARQRRRLDPACDTLASLGYAEREQIRAAGAAQRILVTTRSLPGTMDIPGPFAPALPDRIESLVSACEQTGRSAEEATARVTTPRHAPFGGIEICGKRYIDRQIHSYTR
jgi:hypothetical protein